MNQDEKVLVVVIIVKGTKRNRRGRGRKKSYPNKKKSSITIH